MKKIVMGLIAIVLFTFVGNAQTNIEEINNQLETFKKGLNLKSSAKIISLDENKPDNLDKYLLEIGKKINPMNSFSHIVIDTNSTGGVLDLYAIQYSNDPSKYLFIIENKNDSGVNIIDASLNINSKSINLVSHDDYVIDLENSTTNKRGWSKCFGDCVNAGLDAHGLLGQVIIISGTAGGFGCAPCGFLAATYTGVLLLGCAGGCH